MIAACPKCQAKYRVDAERLSPEGARLRCAKCQAVFRVRAPAPIPVAEPLQEPVSAPATQPVAAPAPAPAAPPQPAPAAPAPPAAAPVQRAAEPPRQVAPDLEAPVDRDRLILVADPDVESGKRVIGVLAAWGLQPVLVHDGVDALLTIQRMLPRAAILDAGLPKMYGFQICEMVKRNESLRGMNVVLVGSVHHQDRYRRPPSELYGADVYMEKPELPEGLAAVLQRFGYTLAAAGPPPTAAPVAAPQPPPQPAPVVTPQPPPQPAPVAAPQPIAAPQPAPIAQPAPAPAPAAVSDDGLAEQRANAERLARIIVSDILLYHPERFEEGLASGRLAEALDSAIEEGRGFFTQRVDPRVRDERDYILDELFRVARERGGQ